MEKDTAPAISGFSAARIAAAVLVGSWCVPALGSSGIDIACDATERSLGDTAVAARPALAAHTETALAEILDDDAIELPTSAETVTRSNIESVEESVAAGNDAVPASETPAIITRLPGVSDTVLPSFRRQMYRTDI